MFPEYASYPVKYWKLPVNVNPKTLLHNKHMSAVTACHYMLTTERKEKFENCTCRYSNRLTAVSHKAISISKVFVFRITFSVK